jgi:putative radical SAM enzyme (TIGR03279 family)
MSAPRIVAIHPESPAQRAGLTIGDEILSINGVRPRDVIQYRLLVDEQDPDLEISRGGLTQQVVVAKLPSEALGAEVHSALFDQVRTCDNHCEFCFIYQLPKGMRKSLYLKDDDYRLSFLYGNFTTLTRFTESDLERVITEGLAPLHVSIHSTDPDLRSEMLRNSRGATSLRWLRALLDHDVEVHGQIVVCPGVNDGDELDATLIGVLEQYPELASLCVVPLGVSDHAPAGNLRSHTRLEAEAVVDIVSEWQERFLELLGHRLVFAADEYYLLAGRAFPEAESYEGFSMHEDGIGMARAFELEFAGQSEAAHSPVAGFFSWVDGAPAEGYRAPRTASDTLQIRPRSRAPIAILTGPLGAQVLAPIVASLGRDDVRIVEVANEFFGGNIGVTGLMVGEDLQRVLSQEPHGHRYLLPDVCLSQDKFLDGLTVADLPRNVEIVSTDGNALRDAISLKRRSAA